MHCPHCQQKLGFGWSGHAPKLKHGICPACGNRAVVAFNTKRVLIALPLLLLAIFLLRHAIPVQLSAFLSSLTLVLSTMELRRA